MYMIFTMSLISIVKSEVTLISVFKDKNPLP